MTKAIKLLLIFIVFLTAVMGVIFWLSIPAKTSLGVDDTYVETDASGSSHWEKIDAKHHSPVDAEAGPHVPMSTEASSVTEDRDIFPELSDTPSRDGRVAPKKGGKSGKDGRSHIEDRPEKERDWRDNSYD